MLGKNDKPMNILTWEVHVANSGAKNFSKYAAIVNVDGEKLKTAVNMREFRIDNADFFDTHNESEKKDDVVNREKKDVEKTVPPPPPKQNTINEGISSGIGPVVIV